MAEVVRRRYSRLKREGDDSVLKPTAGILMPPSLPDLIDGRRRASWARLARNWKNSASEKFLSSAWRKSSRRFICPAKVKPLRLGLDHPAVKLLQRIRDECHRVANSYNAQLRLKKISESVLDEFPGIGERRKAALLKKFGSVQRLENGDAGTNCRGSRFRRQGGGGVEGFFGGAICVCQLMPSIGRARNSCVIQSHKATHSSASTPRPPSVDESGAGCFRPSSPQRFR